MENQTVVNLISPLASDFERNNNKKKRVVKIKAGERDWEWENDRQPHEQWFVSQRQKNMDNTHKQHKQQSIDI